MASNVELSRMFYRMAEVMQLTGENAFKSIAFQKVARALEDLDYDVVEAARAGELAEIPGVGASSRRIIEQYAKDGKSDDYERLIALVPLGVLEMIKIPGLGPKTAAQLWTVLKLESVQELELAIKEGRIAGIKGLGEKKVAGILAGIELLKTGMKRRGYMVVLPIVTRFVDYLKQDVRVGGVQPAGSFRRRRETVGDLDIVCWVHNPEDAKAIIERFTSHPTNEKTLVAGGTKASILVAGGLQVDLRIVPKTSFGAAIQYFTGSKEHNVKLRGLALDRGMTLNEWGLYRLDEHEKAVKKTGEPPAVKSVAGENEASVYQALGLPMIPPELREDRGEIEAALLNRLPALIDVGDIRGDLHCHTSASDGNATIEQMALAAKALGYAYIAITDHSQSSVIANGLSEERLRAHIAAIRRTVVPGITILAGSEVDILPDGRLDYDAALLAELDIVIASPHASLKQDADKANDRMLRAIETRYVNIIGHPTGRMINRREGLPLDMGKIVAAAAKSGTALEINAGWPRWDLCDTDARRAADAGVKISINSDSHSTNELPTIEMGIWVGRRAWLTPQHVINCLSLQDLRLWLNKKR